MILKRITLLIICNLILSFSLLAQGNRSISNAEYFWDSDPGIGNAISLSAVDGSFDQMLEHIFSADTLNFPAYGAHVFNIRIQDEDGTWSPTFKRVIDLSEPNQTRDLYISEAEYYWDTDPGQGNATPLIAFNGAYDEALEYSLSSSFAPLNGIHTLGIRVKDVNGLWSPVYKRVVVLEDQSQQRNFNIVSAEYFWDNDPGTGSGTPILAFDGNFNSSIEELFLSALNFPSYGAHVFNIRIQDENGSWSPSFKRVIDLSEPNQTRDLYISEAEYYWDIDPGQGNATPLIAFNGAYDEALEYSLSSSFAPLNGIHTLGIRVKDVNGLWSPVYKRVVVLEDQSQLRNFNIVGAEYFWDNDPGTGSGTPILAFDGNFNSSIEELYLSALNFPAYGAHVFNIRIQDEDGSWSPTFKRVIDLSEPNQTRDLYITEAEYYWDTDPGEGNATPLIAFNGAYDEALEYSLSSSFAPLNGIHTLGIRVKDVNGLWSPVYRRVVASEINTLSIPGCTDSTALNYDSLATTDDGSCQYCINDSLFTINNSCNSFTWNGYVFDSSSINLLDSSFISFNDYSLNFNGSTDYVDLITSPNVGPSLNSEFSFSVWIKPTSAGGFVISQYDNLNAGNSNFFLNVDQNGTFQLSADGTNSFYFGNVNFNQWQNVTVVFHSSGFTEAYVNGFLEHSGYLNLNQNIGSQTLSLGRVYGNPATINYDGLIDNVVIWDTILTQLDVIEYTTCLLNIDSNIVGLWSFEEGNGNIAIDYSFYSNLSNIYGANYNNNAPPQFCQFTSINSCDSSLFINSILNNCVGCTDSLAFNYYPYALFDDGSCLYNVNGCTDSLANNYNPFATVDDSTCLYSPFAFGCTDSIALNYDLLATVDDSSCCYNSGQLWSQIGQDIIGDGSGWFGTALSSSDDGKIIAVGNYNNANNGLDAGHVRVFENISGNWIQIGQDIEGEYSDDYSGKSVCLSADGSIVAIGAPANDGGGYNSGHVRVFENIVGSWIQIGQDIDGEAANDNFGHSVALSSNGNILAVGAPHNDGNGTNSGHVRIFENTTGSWLQIGQDIDGENAHTNIGYSVSLSSNGNFIAMGGAYDNNVNGNDAGHVRIYENIGGSWLQIGQDIDGEGPADHSGYSISFSNNGNIVAIGAADNDGNGSNSGHVRIYENLGGSWTQVGQDIDGEAAYDESGKSVSLSSDGYTVAIGARNNDGAGSNAGHVRIYSYNGLNWDQLGQDLDGLTAFDLCGWAVSLDSTGNLVTFSGPWNESYGGTNVGHVRQFILSSPCLDLGCLDPIALNFDPYATVDDSSCVYPNYGCLDSLAINYDPLSNIDDGSCNYCTNDTSYTNITACDSVEWNGEWYDSFGTYYSNTVSNNNYSMSFDGTDDEIILSDLTINNSFSFETYVFISSLTDLSRSDAGRHIFSTGANNSTWASFAFGISDITLGVTQPTIVCEFGSPSSNQFIASQSFPLDTWVHIGVTFDNGQLDVYQNGINVLSNSTGLSVSTNAYNSRIGNRGSNWGNNAYQFEGYISYLSYWNSILSQQEIQIYMQCPPTGSETGLVGYWNFEEGSGNTVYDQTSNGNDGTINGSTYDTNVPLQSCQLTTNNGCDSVSVLNLTINNSSTNTVTVTACDSFDWDGVTYTATGLYTNLYSDINGCDSTVNLDLTITSCPGCTDSLANNYNPFATVEDSTCLYSPFVFGCTDSTALNYDPLATVDDSSCCYSNGQLLNQIGQDIDGEAAGDQSGNSVSLSLDGNIVAIGAYKNDGNGNDAGHVRIFENIGGSWTQIGQDIDGESVEDQSGIAVSLSSDGNIIAIGAPFNDGNGTNAGHVRIYENIVGNWTQIGQDIDGEAAHDQSGNRVSLSSDGNTVAVGAPYNDGNGSSSGHVRIYENIGGSWSQIGQDIDGEAAGDFSSWWVSLSSDGNTVAIGAQYNDGNGSNSGHVRIYENIGGSWSQIGQDIDGEAAGDLSGYSVSLSLDVNTIAIGTPLNDGNGSNSGHVRIYENIGGSWSQIGQDIDGEAAGDQSGFSVSLSSDGNTVAIGANFNDGNGSLAGHVRIYENIGGTWTQVGQDIDGEAADDKSGYSVSLSSDGNTVAIGAPLNGVPIGNAGNGHDAGHVRIYSLDSSNIIACLDLGCLDPLALNFDPYATVDDSSCVYPNYGCIDSLALNYNSLSNIDDGSCNYCTNDTSYTNITACDSVQWNGEWYDSSGTYYFSGNQQSSISGFNFSGSIGNSNYYISNSLASWYDADSICNIFGGHLVAINNPNENNFINGLANNQVLWIGLEQNTNNINFIEPAGGWEWVNNDSLNYTNWGIGEPNNMFAPPCNLQNHTVINTSTSFWDDQCGQALRFFVLEIPSNLQTINGCDSIAVLNLTINNSSNNAVTVTACDSYNWDGVTYTSTGLYTNLYSDINGCDSTVTLDLTINNSYSNTVTSTSCDSLVWNGFTYTSTGIYTNTFTAVNGCDSIVNLDLTIINSYSNIVSLIVCNSFIWDGVTYDSTGVYSNTYSGFNGCDSIVIIDLTIYNNSTNTISVIACDSYNWDGTTYTSSGQYINVYTGVNSCDSTVTLDLIINYSNSTYVVDTACDLYIWNGITYNTSGLYSINFTNIYGCDSTAILNLFIDPCSIYGCTDSLALNFDTLATIDDSSCIYYNCQEPAPTNVYSSDIADIRATINWDNMNSNDCKVLKYIIRYRELGTSQWSVRSGGIGNGLCNFGVNNTSQILYNLSSSTTYQYKIKAYYCYGGASVWTLPKYFTTSGDCPEMTNLTTQTYPLNAGKVTFSWDSTGYYVFARVALRVNNSGAPWQTAGGFGVYYPTLSVNKFGLLSGVDYRAHGRTFCDSNITSYRSWWTPPIFWTQPIIRLSGGSAINNLDVYPNPSRNIFNITFNSEKQQDLTIRILNVVGSEVYIEDRENFIGEYTKQINLEKYGKGIYFIEIETDSGIVNKKLIIQ